MFEKRSFGLVCAVSIRIEEIVLFVLELLGNSLSGSEKERKIKECMIGLIAML